MPEPSDAPAERSPWPRALVIAFLLVAAMNAAFIWAAFMDRDPVVESYRTEAR